MLKAPHIASLKLLLLSLVIAAAPGCHRNESQPATEHGGGHSQPTAEGHGGGHEGHGSAKLLVSHPIQQDTAVQRDYVCQIRSHSHIEIRALERGYLEGIFVKEGQLVKEGDMMFKIQPLIYQAELKRAEAEAQAAQVEYENTKRLSDSKVVSETELAISKAKLEKTLAEVNLARTHLNFTEIKAPFPGLTDLLALRKGSLVDEGELLTTLSDNSHMWVYFNVPEAEYLDYASQQQTDDRKVVSLIMANGKTFKHPGRINVIEADFNNQTGTIAFRADFPNPEGLLRHGQTGTIRMKKLVEGAVLIPQKAVFQILDHHYVFVLGEGDVIRQQRIQIGEELEDLFIVSKGLTEKDRIVIEGLLGAKDGAKADFAMVDPAEAYKNLKHHAE